MRKNLLKQLTMALLLTIAVPTLNAQVVHIGDILCAGDIIISPANYDASTHTAWGVVFYVDNTGQHGWAISKSDFGNFRWVNQTSYNYTNTPLQDFTDSRQAVYDLNGYQNTQIVRSCNGGSYNYEAFMYVAFNSGWYVPAIGQLNYLYGNLVEVNTSLEKIGGSKFTGSWEYWSSTEYDAYYAWYLKSNGSLENDHGKNISIYGKIVSRRVRAVRNF